MQLLPSKITNPPKAKVSGMGMARLGSRALRLSPQVSVMSDYLRPADDPPSPADPCKVYERTGAGPCNLVMRSPMAG